MFEKSAADTLASCSIVDVEIPEDHRFVTFFENHEADDPLVLHGYVFMDVRRVVAKRHDLSFPALRRGLNPKGTKRGKDDVDYFCGMGRIAFYDFRWDHLNFTASARNSRNIRAKNPQQASPVGGQKFIWHQSKRYFVGSRALFASSFSCTRSHTFREKKSICTRFSRSSN